MIPKLVLSKVRSIFYNIFLFLEMVAFGELHKQDLAMLFLDFKKYYDRVD